jgi:hypothetical protein
MGLAVPFSTWMGGSLLHWIGYVRVNFPMLLVVSGLATTWNDCKKVFYVIGFASLINLATARLFMQAASTDRLAMEFAGAISNSNDLAAHLLLVLPILLFVVLKPRSPFIVRAIGLTAFVVGLYVILSTGSRGALIALVVTCMYVFFTGTSRQKLTIAVAGPLDRRSDRIERGPRVSSEEKYCLHFPKAYLRSRSRPILDVRRKHDEQPGFTRELA